MTGTGLEPTSPNWLVANTDALDPSANVSWHIQHLDGH